MHLYNQIEQHTAHLLITFTFSLSIFLLYFARPCRLDGQVGLLYKIHSADRPLIPITVKAFKHNSSSFGDLHCHLEKKQTNKQKCCASQVSELCI